jgi:hypothetical protein
MYELEGVFMKRFAMLAAVGLISMLPSVASARGRVSFGFGVGFGGPVFSSYCYRPGYCYSPYWYGNYYCAPSYVYVAPPVVYSPPPAVVYAPAPAPAYTTYAAPTYVAPAQTTSGGVTYYYYH